MKINCVMITLQSLCIYLVAILVLLNNSTNARPSSYLSYRERRSGTADQELFHILEKMKNRPNPVAGIIDVNRIGKRFSKDRSFPWKDRVEDQQQQDWPFSDFSNYGY